MNIYTGPHTFSCRVIARVLIRRSDVVNHSAGKTSAIRLQVFQHVCGSVIITFMSTNLDNNIDDRGTSEFSYKRHFTLFHDSTNVDHYDVTS